MFRSEISLFTDMLSNDGAVEWQQLWWTVSWYARWYNNCFASENVSEFMDFYSLLEVPQAT